MMHFECFVLALIPLLLICGIALRRSLKTVKPNASSQRCLPITRGRIFRIAAGSYIAGFLLLSLSSVALIALACVHGRMHPTAAIFSVLLILSVFFLCCYPQIHSQCRPLLPILKMPDFNRAFSGKKLLWQAEAWEYIDDDWFIHLSLKSSVLLNAQQINFSIPARIIRNTWFSPSKFGSGMGQSLFFLRFTCLNGKNTDANTPVDTKLQQWIEHHGGTISNHFPQ